MKKIKIIIAAICILIVIATSTFFLFQNDTKNNNSENNYPSNENNNKNDNYNEKIKPAKENEGLTYNKNSDSVIQNPDGLFIDKNSNKTIYDPQKDYTQDYLYYYDIEEIPVKNLDALLKDESNEYFKLYEYLKYIFWLFPERSIDHFTNEEMGAIIALAAPLFVPRTEKEIQLVAKTYFGIDNFEIPIGDYSI